MKAVIACGGSGGHIFPGIALAQELLNMDKGFQILMVCSNRPLDIHILEKSPFNFEVMDYNPLSFTLNPLKILLFFIKLMKNTALGMRLISRHRPDCAVGFGGSISGPIIFAAWLCGIPGIVHEQNLIAGLANRIEGLFAQKIAVSFDQTKRFFNGRKVIKTGNPIRRDFSNLDKDHSVKRFGLDKERFTIFILGGSQGANFLNNIMPGSLELMDYEQKKSLQVLHITGKRDFEPIRERYKKINIKSKVFQFLDEIDKAYIAADLIIARAGATTIAELAHFGRPSILIPYPSKRVHQKENAQFLSDNNAAITIEEKELDAGLMKETLLRLMEERPRLEEMAENLKPLKNPDAGYLLAKEVTSLIRGPEC